MFNCLEYGRCSKGWADVKSLSESEGKLVFVFKKLSFVVIKLPHIETIIYN